MISTETCPNCVNSPLEDNNGVLKIKWTQCDKCNQWFHNICIDMTTEVEQSVHLYHCASCSRKHGTSVLRRTSKRARTLIDYVALNSGDAYAIDKSMHPHLPNFMKFEGDSLGYITSDRLDTLMLNDMKPIHLPNVDLNLVGMILPKKKEDITIDYITEKVGPKHPVEVMDVLTQLGVLPSWNMERWQQYFNSQSRDRLRNVITLEISKIKELGTGFKRPDFVDRLDLVDKVWKGSDRPAVTKYCLMSVKNSFTDFHIDFGGTSVYYTVFSGAKIFLMYPPTVENLHLYNSWCLEPEQNYTWFGNYSTTLNRKRIYPTGGIKVSLSPGDLFIIPSGWIHSVYTPEDSIVIGGNFITLNDMELQLKIVEIEKLTKVPAKFRFPMFNKVLWLTSWYYYKHQSEFREDLNGDKTKIEQVLFILIKQLKSHYEISKSNSIAKKSIPVNLIRYDIDKYIADLEDWLYFEVNGKVKENEINSGSSNVATSLPKVEENIAPVLPTEATIKTEDGSNFEDQRQAADTLLQISENSFTKVEQNKENHVLDGQKPVAQSNASPFKIIEWKPC